MILVHHFSFISCALARWRILDSASGTHRWVLFVRSYAIKFPVLWPWRLFLCGLLANMQEASFSAAGWPKLCPVLFAMPGGWFNVMERATALSDDEWASLDYAEFIKAGKDLPDGEWILPVENKQCSFGKLHGQIVAVDYGS